MKAKVTKIKWDFENSNYTKSMKKSLPKKYDIEDLEDNLTKDELGNTVLEMISNDTGLAILDANITFSL